MALKLQKKPSSMGNHIYDTEFLNSDAFPDLVYDLDGWLVADVRHL